MRKATAATSSALLGLRRGVPNAVQLIAFVLLVFVSWSAHAAMPTQSGWYAEDVSPRKMRPTYQAACEDAYEKAKISYASWGTGNVIFWGYQFFEDDPNGERVVRCVVHPEGTNAYPYYDVWFTSYCPSNSKLIDGSCKCDFPLQQDSTNTSCIAATPQPPSNMCMAGLAVGKPIFPATGEESFIEDDLRTNGPASLPFTRFYRSGWGGDASRASSILGQAWTHNYNTSLKASPATSPIGVEITLPQGYVRSFTLVAGTANWTAANSADTLTQVGSGWSWHRGDDDSTYNFDGSGKLQTTVLRNGRSTGYTYNGAGQIETVFNSLGRSLAFTYSADKLVAVTSSDGRTLSYSYDGSGRLTTVGYPDSQSRSYLYENSSYPWALTGIQDEAGQRYATITYDSNGRATNSQLAGGAYEYKVSYPWGPGYASVTDPLGTNRTYSYSAIQGQLAVSSSSLLSGEGEDVIRSRTQDANGLITKETDFNYVDTTLTWDSGRRLPTSVTRASGTPDAQTVTTQWHAMFALPVLVSEAGRTTAYTYDVLGNVLSRTVTDTSVTPNTAKTWQWTYTPQSFVATETAPNGAATSYNYNAFGNVTQSTNALGHVTQYGYDSLGRLTSVTQPNGVVTTYTYDARDRLLTQTVGGQTTTMTYKPTGLVETVTFPNGLVLTYSYDAAHRLTGWSNNRGESGIYTLDGMGNRTNEQISAGSTVAWQVVRSINEINRLDTQTEGFNHSTGFRYNANGDVTRKLDGFSWDTNYGRDSLGRLKSVVNPNSNIFATLSYNALNAVTQVRDFQYVVTDYARDAQGNATAESSADIGSRSIQYDNLGLPSQVTDALGQATTITRDALGRPTGLVFADGKTTTLRYDLSANSKGYLSEIIDRSGTTEYTRDAFGRVTLKKQTLANGSVQQVSYAYNANGTLASIGYPNGGTLSHIYDATGRLTGLNWNGNPLVSGIAWNPLGQPTAWTWAFTTSSPKLAASRSYDTAGRLTSTEFSSYGYDAAGRITSLMQNLWQPGDADPTHSTISNANSTWSVGYDPVGRLTSFNTTGDTAGFSYDANGNRGSSSRTVNGITTGRNYRATNVASNRLAGFNQTINGASNTSVTYGYNANGDLLTDGLRSYTYDAEGRLAAATTGATDVSPTTRYAHNALGQRVFKTEPLYPPAQGDEADPGFMASLIAFFTKLWSPTTTQAEQLGYAYTYDEQGTLIAEVGSGGTASAGQSQYIYLPTANGPMPIAAVIDGTVYAVHSDHLNTPRKLTNADGQAVWQWGYSAFGEDKPTTAKNRFANTETTPNPGTTGISEVKFNLRYPGQYADEESGLSYNYFRSYDARTGRYSQPDPVGLDGGWNRFGYVSGNPLGATDPRGLFGIAEHAWITGEALGGDTSFPGLPGQVSGVDGLPGSQDPSNSFWHAMRDGKTGQSPEEARRLFDKYVDDNIRSCTQEGLARALHAVQDTSPAGHRGFQAWSGGFGGIPSPAHLRGDVLPSKRTLDDAIEKSKEVLRRYKASCPC